MLSVVLLGTPNLRPVVAHLVDCPTISEIIIWNNKRLPHYPQTIAIDSEMDVGPCGRFIACKMAKNDSILLYDDNVVLPYHTIKMLYNRWTTSRRVLHGVVGYGSNILTPYIVSKRLIPDHNRLGGGYYDGDIALDNIYGHIIYNYPYIRLDANVVCRQGDTLIGSKWAFCGAKYLKASSQGSFV